MRTIIRRFIFAVTALAAMSQTMTVQAQGAARDANEYIIAERGPHHRKWEKVTEFPRRDGTTAYRTNSYIELATCMHYQNEAGRWVESREEITILNGSAFATQGPIKVSFAANLNSAGAIDLLAPDGKRFRSHVLGLFYTDYASGQSVMIAQLKDSIGGVLPPNQVIYQDAFAGDFVADVRYTYSKAAFEQDIILVTAPPSPSEWGLNPETTRLEVMTEFLEAPEARVTSVVLKAETDFFDQHLDFGSMIIGQGQAFPLGEGADPFSESSVPTGKSLQYIDGRLILIEKVDYPAIRDHLGRLPKSASIDKDRKVGLPDPGRTMMASLLPSRPSAMAGKWQSGQYAKLDTSRKGFVLDYVTMSSSSLTNYNFISGGTYHIGGTLELYGDTIAEGLAVLKYNSSASVRIRGTIDCRTAAYRPLILTAKDDDTVGEIISGSTSSPGNSYGAPEMIYLINATVAHDLHDIHASHAYRAITMNANSTATISHLQVGNSRMALGQMTGSTLHLRNFLFHDLSDHATVISGTPTNRSEHGTMHLVKNFRSGSNGLFTLTNSLLIAVTNNHYYQGAYNVSNSTDSGYFQTVGAATHYLAAGSTNRNAGTTNINPTLLTELARRTTYPPVVFTSHITASTNLEIQATRDEGTPDLGYHFDPLDFVASQISVTNATVTLAEGVALGVYGASGSYGLRLEDGAVLNATGSPLNPCRIVRYNLVQEQANTNWSASSVGRSIVDASWGGSPRPIGQFKFTDWSTPAGGQEHFEGDYGSGPDTAWFGFTHCQFHGGSISTLAANLAFTNCLFDRVSLTDYSAYSDYHNSTFLAGSIEIDGGYGGHRALNNLFDQTTIVANYVTNNYNGYGTNQNRIWSGGANDVVLITTNLPFETGPLGRFYVSTNSLLVDAGSMSAANAGLYHFTTATNQTKEGSSTLDLGFHYVALTNGVLPDYDFDGLADYLEDRNGNGLGDIGETTWLHSDTDYDGRSDGDEITDGTDSLNSSSVKLVRLGHWRFDDATLAGDEGQLPDPTVSFNVVPPVASWSGSALYMTNTSRIRYREIETNGRPNINLRNGTVRFWFKPDWSSTTLGGTGPQNDARLIELGAYSTNFLTGQWELGLETTGTKIHFSSASNGIRTDYIVAPCGFSAGYWHQIALTYSPSNVALYINGSAVTNLNVFSGTQNVRPHSPSEEYWINSVSAGIYNYPDAAMRANGFRIGNDWGGGQQAKGKFEELETFNYPLTPQQIARDFPNFSGASSVTNDMDYDGRSDILEYQADGTTTNSASSVVGGRLGYWRFNGATNNLLGEAMQAPLVVSGVSVTPGWSSNALAIPDGSTARVVYRDVETNGWANFNCRAGAVRFWFLPNWSWDGTGTDGSFVFIGNSTSETLGRWDLGIKGPGKKIWFRTSTNGTSTTLFEASFNFISNRWSQIALNYGASSVSLYVNGILITNRAVGVTQWPSLADRANGLAIGNNHAGTRPVNGRFDELETFNRQLTTTEIQRSFSSVNSLDSDLNGVPDLLEDIALTSSRPFVGVPFVVTGCIEAEQFDAGGKGIAYNNVASNWWTNDYRASGMEITNCTDRGGGYQVDRLKAGDWMKYTLDVKVAQTYAIEPRVAGLGTGGVFHIQFFTNGNSTPYATTGPLTITTTNWTNITYKMLSLAKGTNVMKVLMTNNASSGYVGKLNYISVYPSWNEGVPVLYETNTVTGLSTEDTWDAAINNAALIQEQLDALSTNGCVILPAGRYLVAQPVVDETKDAHLNTALFLPRNNIVIRGAGKTNTVLVAHNRATTILHAGANSLHEPIDIVSRTNLVVTDLTIEARPHWVAVTNTAAGGYTNRWEEGSLWPIKPNHTGETIVCEGNNDANRNSNLLFTNCLFRNHGSVAIRLSYNNSNVAVRACDFIMRDGTNGTFTNFTREAMLTTSNLPPTSVGVHVRAGACPNIVMTDCMFNGNPSLTNVNTEYSAQAADGIFYGQGPGNWFIARNAITNYGLEGIQFNSGPSAAVGNVFDTFVSVYAACALNGFGAWPTVTGLTNDSVIWFVGNQVNGGRFGELAGSGLQPFTLHFTGNTVGVYPPFDRRGDYPGGAVLGAAMTLANIAGNRLVSGGHGVNWRNGSMAAVVLKNDFAAAAYLGLAYDGTNGVASGVAILKNQLGQGVSFHLRVPESDAGRFYLWRNYYTNGVTTVNPFTDSANAPVHFVH